VEIALLLVSLYSSGGMALDLYLAA
jgi:hypothetical protein